MCKIWRRGDILRLEEEIQMEGMFPERKSFYDSFLQIILLIYM